jgi:hypothetical protein
LAFRLGMKFACTLAFLAILGRAPGAPPMALGNNESLTYHVSWAVVPGAGEIKVSAQATTSLTGTPLLRIVSTTATRGLARLLLPFSARAESLFDPVTGRLMWLGESSQNRREKAAHIVVFDYARRTANYTDGASDAGTAASTRALPMPDGNPTDLITCLLLARTWNLRPGEQHDALVLFNDDFYELTVHALGYEMVATPFGTFNALALDPRMEKTPLKGMFKRGSTVRVWISQDERHLPVRFQVHFKFGSGLATLVEYHPPTP